MKAVGYIRVSTERQAAEGISLEAQRARIEAYCTAMGYELQGVHVDAGLSGTRADNRPALQTALSEACEQKAVMVVYSLSRLARSTKDAIAISERLAKAGANLASLSEQIDTSSAAGKLFFTIMASLAEFSANETGERTKMALAHLKSRGLSVGGVRIGQRIVEGTPGPKGGVKGGRIERDEAEAAAVRRARELAAEGHSLRKVGRKLMAEGHRPRRGAWHHSTIGRMIGLRPVVSA